MLKKVIHWIAHHGISAYDPATIAKDINVDVSELPTSALNAFDVLFSETQSTTFNTLNITTPHTSDDLFECILSFFESLQEYKDAVKTIYQTENLSLEHLSFLPIFHKLSACFFQNDIKTFLDKAAYHLIMIKLFYTWLQDSSADLATTSHSINQLCHSIFSNR